MKNSLFRKLPDYKDYLSKYPIHELFNIDLEKYGALKEKKIRTPYESVNRENSEPFSVELDDLIRLHHLIISRKVTTILEIGVGKSTAIFDHALSINKSEHLEFVTQNLRRSNAFECHSIDNNQEWIDSVKTDFPELNLTEFHFCKCEVDTFNSRICTYYNGIPNICPDLIYLDAPDQFSPSGNVRGLSTNHPDRMPMSADILAIEHFLCPGTLIVVDGRTANARFLKANFQRNWDYWHSVEYDQHFFELKEKPLGVFNQRQVEFCLGKNWNKS
tara:strand:- start:368 stop:1189 length:822 start_codon:yes stop_codon:yes gene_type:complete